MCLPLAPAMHDHIIRVALERDGGELPGHPRIKRVVQEDVGQHGRERRPLRSPAIARAKGAVRVLQRRFQPPLDVEQEPPLTGVVSDRAQDELGIERVEERPDVKIDHPVVSPTPFATARHRIMRRAPRPIAIRIRVEHGLHERLQVQPGDRLGNPIGDSRHTERPDPLPACLRELHRPHGRRHVAPRGHPIPELEQVPLQVCLKLRDRFLVDTRGTLVGPHLLSRPPRPRAWKSRTACRSPLALARSRAPPATPAVGPRPKPDDPSPSLHPHYRASQLHHRTDRPCAPHRYSAPSQFCCLEFSRARPPAAGPSRATGRPAPSRRQVPTCHAEPRPELAPPSRRAPRRQSAGSPHTRPETRPQPRF